MYLPSIKIYWCHTEKKLMNLPHNVTSILLKYHASTHGVIATSQACWEKYTVRKSHRWKNRTNNFLHWQDIEHEGCKRSSNFL